MFDLGSADAESQRAESAMRRGMAVAANHHHAGVDETMLRHNNMNHTVIRVCHVIQLQAVHAAVFSHGFDLFFGNRIGNRQVAIFGRYAVIHRSKNAVRIAHLATGQTQTFKGLGTGDFMHQMSINIKQRSLPGLINDKVAVPDFFVHGLFHSVFQSLHTGSTLSVRRVTGSIKSIIKLCVTIYYPLKETLFAIW